ncbi:hypothetical protein ACFX13_031208 [Malus domestica]
MLCFCMEILHWEGRKGILGSQRSRDSMGVLSFGFLSNFMNRAASNAVDPGSSHHGVKIGVSRRRVSEGAQAVNLGAGEI